MLRSARFGCARPPDPSGEPWRRVDAPRIHPVFLNTSARAAALPCGMQTGCTLHEMRMPTPERAQRLRLRPRCGVGASLASPSHLGVVANHLTKESLDSAPCAAILLCLLCLGWRALGKGARATRCGLYLDVRHARAGAGQSARMGCLKCCIRTLRFALLAYPRVGPSGCHA